MNGDQQSIQAGWPVAASDGKRIGTVREVREDHLVVEHGLIGGHMLYVPLDAIERTTEDSVVLNIESDAVGRQGWEFQPSAHYEKGEIAPPEVPATTMIQAAGYSAGTLSAPEAQGFALGVDGEDDILANRAIDPEMSGEQPAREGDVTDGTSEGPSDDTSDKGEGGL